MNAAVASIRLSRLARRRRPIAWPALVTMPELVPVTAMAAIIGTAIVWNSAVGLHFQPSLALEASPGVALSAASLYCAARRVPFLAEVSLYLGLWYLLPVFGIILSYLCFSLGAPTVDSVMLATDAALGFDWLTWTRFTQSHPWLWGAEAFGYMSNLWQPTVLIVAAAVCMPRRRNAETLTALCLSLAVTVAIMAASPTVGPAGTVLGMGVGLPIITTLHTAPGVAALPLKGIVAFPSFHTVMAIQFAYACRGMRGLFPAAIGLNALMLLAVPACGDHYLVDMLAGAVVAACGIALARVCVLPQHRAAPTTELGLRAPGSGASLGATPVRRL